VHRLYSDHLASYYQEVAKTQAALATRGFRDWLASLGFTNLCMFVSTRCIELLASVFGASRVHIVSYDGAMAAGRSLVDVVACDVAKLACRDGELVGSHPKPVKRVKTQKTVMSLKDETTQKKRFANVSPPLGAYSASTLFNLAAQRLQCAARMHPSSESALDLYSSASAAALCPSMEEVTLPIRKSHFLCDSCLHTYLRSAPVNSYMFDNASATSTRLSCELDASSSLVQAALDRALAKAGCPDQRRAHRSIEGNKGGRTCRAAGFWEGRW